MSLQVKEAMLSDQASLILELRDKVSQFDASLRDTEHHSEQLEDRLEESAEEVHRLEMQLAVKAAVETELHNLIQELRDNRDAGDSDDMADKDSQELEVSIDLGDDNHDEIDGSKQARLKRITGRSDEAGITDKAKRSGRAGRNVRRGESSNDESQHDEGFDNTNRGQPTVRIATLPPRTPLLSPSPSSSASSSRRKHKRGNVEGDGESYGDDDEDDDMTTHKSMQRKTLSTSSGSRICSGCVERDARIAGLVEDLEQSKEAADQTRHTLLAEKEASLQELRDRIVGLPLLPPLVNIVCHLDTLAFLSLTLDLLYPPPPLPLKIMHVLSQMLRSEIHLTHVDYHLNFDWIVFCRHK